MQHLFGPRWPLAERYAALLTGPGVARGLLGPREAHRIWDRHILNCAVVADALAPGAVVCDLGSGAGLPGLILAIARPDVSMTLLEPLLRRATFLEEVVGLLALDNVRVCRARAEALVGEAEYDVVTARAVAPLARLASWGLPLLLPGGEVLALKGVRARDEIEASGPALRRLGVASVEIDVFGIGVVEPATTVVRLKSGRGSPPRAKGQR